MKDYKTAIEIAREINIHVSNVYRRADILGFYDSIKGQRIFSESQVDRIKAYNNVEKRGRKKVKK